MTTERRVAVIGEANAYSGPGLARELAARGHDVVLGDASPGLVEELTAMGARAVDVTGTNHLLDASGSQRLVDAALSEFGRLDAATTATGVIVTGRFLNSSIDDFNKAVKGCLEVPYHFLRAVVPVMVERRAGQVLLQTSAAGARPTPGAPLYSTARAGANMLVRNVAAEVAAAGVQVNAVGTNFMDFPGFLAANGVKTEEDRVRVESAVPMKRLGDIDEFARFCAAFLDGSSTFVTGQFVAYAGGWA
ncbi:MAG: SDR family oxidoreductase [Ilumatobacteraceae bacterium]|jgi:3-oxoacyl-[acyl-carrier protein] reductase